MLLNDKLDIANNENQYNNLKSDPYCFSKKNSKKKLLNNQFLNRKLDMWHLYDLEIKSKKISTDEYLSSKSLNENLCDLCNSALELNEDSFLICSNKQCSIIYKNNIDYSPEWRYYGADDTNNADPTRCGMPINPLLKESNYGCKVLVSGYHNYEIHKIKKYTDWQSMPYREKALYDEFQKIINIANNNGIPKIIIDEAMRIHKQISEVRTFRGLNRDGIIAASIYISSRTNNYPRTAKEIANIFMLDNSSATKGCKNALLIMNEIENESKWEDKSILHQSTPITFIERYCSKLNINNELTMLCKFIANKVTNNNLIPENTPHSIASGIIYFVSYKCNLNITKNEINNISKISEVTINKCFKKLEQMQNTLIPNIILEKYKIS